MSEADIVNALDDAEYVQARTICGVQYVAVWHGGIGVSVYCPQTSFHDTWDEVAYFSISDEQGEPCSQDEIADAMIEHFEQVESEVRR